MTTKEYDTVSIQLGAAILAGVSGSYLAEVDGDALIGDRKVFRIGYDERESAALRQLVQAFKEKRLSVSLYEYNRCLNLLRDRLKAFGDGKWGDS